MNDALLGSKYVVSFAKADQIVDGPGSSFVLKETYPCSSKGTPRWSRYQALRRSGSFALKKMPPMPVTRSMNPSLPRRRGPGSSPSEGTPPADDFHFRSPLLAISP